MTEASEDPRIPAVLAEKPTVVWFAFGNDLFKYISQVREIDSKREHKTKIFCCVNSLEEAKRAANEWKVDVLVVQGMFDMSFLIEVTLIDYCTGVEAGGHGSSLSPPILNFVPAVRAALPNIPIVAAGGVSFGSQVAALLTLGADGVVLGTRFLFTNECCYTDQMKKVLVESGFNSTERSGAYDQAFGTDFWPSHIDGRAISTNDVMKDFKAGLPLEERVKNYKEATEAGKDTHLIMWAGVGVAHTNKISPAAVRIVYPLRSIDHMLTFSAGGVQRDPRGCHQNTARESSSVEVIVPRIPYTIAALSWDLNDRVWTVIRLAYCNMNRILDG